jgi:hypothetical protein
MTGAKSARHSLSALPVTLSKPPVAVVLDPILGYPVLAAAFPDPTAFHPDVLASIPIPVAGRPHVSHPRRRYLNHTHGRRRNVDLNTVAVTRLLAGARVGNASA